MALYAFDGTGDRWSPGTRWNLKDIRELTPEQKQELIATITPEQKTDKDRYLTNVVFFYKEYIESGLHAEYFPGVGSGAFHGTQFGITLDFIFGGLFGIGAQGIVDQAFVKLQKNFEKGENIIDIVGYSRGAAIACIFANKIFRDYKKIISPSLRKPPKIRFIGLFDTVASFGNPLNDNELFFKKDLPSNVENTFHAMSLDLNSPGFGLDRVYGENVLEVWFRGGHGDIGGNSSLEGRPNRKRTNITLNFMLQKAKSAGVGLRNNLILPPDASDDNPLTYPIDIQSSIAVSRKPRGDASRQPRKYDIFHYSFFDEKDKEIKPRIVGNDLPIDLNLPLRDRLVIEEIHNESQISRQQLLQLTPGLIEKFPNTKSLYDWLYEK
jgi:Uncharacterized alpha/beta hydrolase domain (DUF2235)